MDDNRTSTVLVTGASGRLGTALLPRLMEAGDAVRAASRRPALADGPVAWVRADLTTGDGLTAAVREADAVVHLASVPYQRGYTVAVEIDGTRRLLDAARAAGVGHVVADQIVHRLELGPVEAIESFGGRRSCRRWTPCGCGWTCAGCAGRSCGCGFPAGSAGRSGPATCRRTPSRPEPERGSPI
ncbi:SDR family oxidoreductase [Flindersiella endophytica]